MVHIDKDDSIMNVEEENNEKTAEFSWGKKISSTKGFDLYQSFHYGGVEYSRKDCVYLWGEDDAEPDIGMITKIWETPKHQKRVKVVWFFRPVEIRHWLGDYKPQQDELLLASGKGDGIFNFQKVEAMAGKCKVICTSKDTRNIPASAEDLKESDFYFCRTFDVDTHTISSKFPKFIAEHDVNLFFNQKKNVEVRARPATQALIVEDGNSSTSTRPLEKQVSKSKFVAVGCGKHARSSDEDTTLKPKNIVPKEVTRIIKSSSPLGKRKFKSPTVYSQIVKKRRLESTSGTLAKRPKHEGRFLDSKLSTSGEPIKSIFNQKTDKDAKWILNQKSDEDKAKSQMLDVTERPDMVKRNWFHQIGWDERMKIADKDGSLVLLQNLDPSYTSSEVEDIIFDVLKKNVSAKMVQRTSFSSQHSGEAYVIFNSKGSAESAIYELYKRCLVLSGGRPVVACRRPIQKEPGSTPSKFPGHIVLQRLHFMRQEMRDAVSTSHCSQPNTIEYLMAIEWRALQEKSRMWWDALLKNQADDIEKYRARFKTDYNLLAEEPKATQQLTANLPTKKPKLTL